MLEGIQKSKLKVIAVATLGLFLASCGGETPAPVLRTTVPVVDQPTETTQESILPDDTTVGTLQVETDEQITIGIMLPLSGSEGETGKALLRAATMALFDAYNPNVKLLPFDTQADYAQTQIVAEQAVEAGVSVVIGPLLASNVEAAGEVLAPHGITLIGFSNDSGVAKEGRFIMGFMPETEVKRVLNYAYQSGMRKYAALVPEGRYGSRVQAVFGETVSSAGANILAIESYPPDMEALEDPVKRIASYDERRRNRRDEIRFLRSLSDDLTDEIADDIEKSEVLEDVEYEAILLPEGGDLLKNLAPLLPFYEVDPNKIKLLGTGLWSDESLLREPPLQGAWFAGPQPEAPLSFMARFEEAYGEAPPRIATLAYDAMSLVSFLIKEDMDVSSVKDRFSADILTGETGFIGIDGLFRFLPDGTIERTLAVLEVNRRGFQVIDPAPEAFPSFGFALSQ